MINDKINANEGAPGRVPKSAFRGAVANTDDSNVTNKTESNTHEVFLSGNVKYPFFSDCNAITTKRIPPKIGRIRFLINNPLIPNKGKKPINIKPTTERRLIKKNCE